MQWAVRNTPSQRATGSTPSSSSTPAGQFVVLVKCVFVVQEICHKNCVFKFTCYDFCFFTASSTGLIYIDPTNLRRSSAISSSAAAAAAALEASNSSSYLTSASSLARAYSIVIRQISDLMSLIPKYNHLVYSQYPAAVKLTYNDAVNLQVRYTILRSYDKSRLHYSTKAPRFWFLNEYSLLCFFFLNCFLK